MLVEFVRCGDEGKIEINRSGVDLARRATFLNNEAPGISISDKIQDRLRSSGQNAPEEGVAIALELVEQMKPWASGIYLMPAFNRYDLAAEIVERCR